jgi:hypothetical protein
MTAWSTDPPGLHFEPPDLYCFEPLKLLNFDFNADPDPAFHFNADSDLASKINADRCGSATLFLGTAFSYLRSSHICSLSHIVPSGQYSL